MKPSKATLSEAIDYDEQWNIVNDFIRYNPGARHRRRWLISQLKRIRFQNLLDAGCGNGELLIAIRREFPPAITLKGVDVSISVIEKNRQKLLGIEFESLDIETQGLSESFDVIICSEVIEHLQNQRAAFRNLAGMLRPSGILLLTCPTGRVYATERKFGHTTHPKLKEIEQYAKENDFRILNSMNWGFPIYNILKWMTNLTFAWSMKNFASGDYSPFSKFLSSLCYYANFLNIPSSPMGCQFMISLQKASASRND